ncbi:hypothetical protein BG003_011803, partial [Podila horticola]
MLFASLLKSPVHVEGESTPFPVKIEFTETIGELKKAIKAEKANDFRDVDADKLTLWKVSIQITDDDDEIAILLNSVTGDKKKLGPATRLSKVFPEELPEKTVHIIVQRPSQSQSDGLHPEVAALRKQLSDMKQLQEELLDSSISLSVVVKPEKKVAFTWSTFVDEATLDDFKSYIFEYYPQYAHDEYLEIFLYNGHPKPERTFKDVCEEYNLSESSDPDLAVIPPFTDINAAALDSDFEKTTLAQLTDEVETFVD